MQWMRLPLIRGRLKKAKSERPLIRLLEDLEKKEPAKEFLGGLGKGVVGGEEVACSGIPAVGMLQGRS